jgi:hypothetical protein
MHYKVNPTETSRLSPLSLLQPHNSVPGCTIKLILQRPRVSLPLSFSLSLSLSLSLLSSVLGSLSSSIPRFLSSVLGSSLQSSVPLSAPRFALVLDSPSSSRSPRVFLVSIPRSSVRSSTRSRPRFPGPLFGPQLVLVLDSSSSSIGFLSSVSSLRCLSPRCLSPRSLSPRGLSPRFALLESLSSMRSPRFGLSLTLAYVLLDQ